MASQGNLKKLKTSWTKYDVVRVIDIIANNKLDSYLNYDEIVDEPVLKAYLGINSFSDAIPKYWITIINEYPQYSKLFTLLAGIFTHHENIENFANIYGTHNMGGIFKIGNGGKHQTNLRSALVEAGAALTSYRRKPEVPYEFTQLLGQDDIGKYFKQLLEERLKSIGYKDEEIKSNFWELAFENDFHKAISLNKQQFKNWLEGKAVFQIKEFKYDLSEFQTKYQKNLCFKINQWLNEWNDVNFNLPMRKKPDGYFYMFKIDIRLLKRISDVHRRKAQKPRIEEVNIQRSLKEDRSAEIKNFVHKGFPLSTLTEKNRLDEENDVLKMPGFLPTAILVNVLGPDQKRGNSLIHTDDLIKINKDGNETYLTLPDIIFNQEWNPELKPIEIIDGQHRLWAFDETEQIDGNFEVPVIAYYNLDRTWQAYLFYVINIKPKKINTSLGYDLYPLLRTQEWLENSKEGLKVYRETRAQELVEALWLYPESPWHKRISMLGDESSFISQNAFIRALSDSYFKKTRREISGLFSEVLIYKNEELKWVRPQQAAFIILIWDEIAKALNKENMPDGQLEWVDALREENIQFNSVEKELDLDKSFISKNSNLSRDQGVTGISMFSNDFFCLLANDPDIDYNLLEWDKDIDERQIEFDSIDIAINKFIGHPIHTYIKLFAKEIVKLDWRTSSAKFNDPAKAELQKKYGGSGGYTEIWNDLLKLFLASNDEKIVQSAILLDQLH